MTLCDLCGKEKDCVQKEIDGKEHDLCGDCWDPIAEKLKGKGRKIKERERVFLPHIETQPAKPDPKPTPGEPPKIWGSSGTLH